MENENVEANAIAQTVSPDISQGFPVTETVGTNRPPQPQEQPSGPQEGHETTEVAPEGIMTPEELQAANNRLKQQSARNAKLLASLGLDPLSDLGEQLESGLITPEMVRNHVVGQAQPPVQQQTGQVPQPTDPVSQAEAAYLAAKDACRREGEETNQVSFATMETYNEAVLALQDAKANAVSQQFEARSAVEQANANVDRVLSVARNNQYYNGFTEEAKQASDFAHVALTRAIAENESQRLGLDPNRLSPQQYEYFAQKAASQLGMLAENISSVGQFNNQQQRQTPQQLNNRPPVLAQPTGSVIPPGNPFANVNHTNHLEAARKYQQNAGRA